MMQNLHSILSGEKMLLMLPDGTLTTVPINLAGVGVGAMADASRRKEEQLRSPVRVHKRARSPETESESRSISPPKRRRSSSLPDITQFTVPRSRGRATSCERAMKSKPRSSPCLLPSSSSSTSGGARRPAPEAERAPGHDTDPQGHEVRRPHAGVPHPAPEQSSNLSLWCRLSHCPLCLPATGEWEGH